MSDKNDRIFYFQVFITIVTMGFCIGMIIHSPDSSTTSIYLPIFSGSTLLWFQATKSIPPPSLLPLTTQGTSQITLTTPVRLTLDQSTTQEPTIPNETTPLVTARTPLQIENENNV